MATRGEAEEVLPRLFGSVRSVAPVRGAVTAMNGSRLQATCTPIRGALMATISSRRKKSVALALAAVLTLAGAGAAFAYWTSTGEGDGSATTGADVAFEITSETAVGTIAPGSAGQTVDRSEEHTSELQSPMRISYAGFCLYKKNQ